MFLEISCIASGLRISASETGTESASGKTNSLALFEEFLHEKPTNIRTNKNTLPFIQDVWVNTKIQKIRLTTH
jgi:hypothetical protein